MALVGGGQGAFIGRVHATAAVLDNRAELVAGALSSDPAKAKASGASAADKKADDESKEAAEIAAAAPTASKESAGIGPQSIETNTVVGKGEGSTREVASGNGQKKTVRVIAPDVIPVPNVQN